MRVAVPRDRNGSFEPVTVTFRVDQMIMSRCGDGLKGLPDSARTAWPLVDVQLCVVHPGPEQSPLRQQEPLGPDHQTVENDLHRTRPRWG